MRILLAIVHYWDPNGDGHHQSTRPNAAPRIAALQDQLLALRRLGMRRSYLHMGDCCVYPADDVMGHEIDVRVITDGEHHVLNNLAKPYTNLFQEVITNPQSGKMLGFEAQKFLGEHVDSGYDLLGYFEDDLIIHDPLFFHKIKWFEDVMGSETVLLPQRFEMPKNPSIVDRFYIDGPLGEEDLSPLNLKKGPVVVVPFLSDEMVFITPKNPHAGCFVLSNKQLSKWIDKRYWLDLDCSFISPLESSATLGISKTFRIYKPSLSHAAWLEIEHWGISFHSLIEGE